MSWKTVSSQKKAAFPLFQVYEDQVKLPNGLELDYYWVDKTPAVVMLPVIEDSIVMVKQYRYAIKSESLELPAGHKNPDETPEECAMRELKEETGYTAGNIEKLISFHPSTEYSTQVYHIFILKDLKEGKAEREQYEIMDVEVLKTESVIEKIVDGTITDGRTIVAVSLAKLLKKI